MSTNYNFFDEANRWDEEEFNERVDEIISKLKETAGPKPWTVNAPWVRQYARDCLKILDVAE